jgi:uncharacterized small protein (DUF1192 family)
LTASARRPIQVRKMDDDLPRAKGDAASLLAKELLDSYSQDELGERITLLEAEIARVAAHRSKVATHRAAADALFKSSSS